YIAFVPAATTKGIVARARTKEREIQNKLDEAKSRGREIETVLSQRKSALPPDSIGPEALARITKLAQAGGLRLTGFRPQRAVVSPSGLTMYPYTLTIEGSFPATAKFARAIESTTKDIAVISYAATSSDAESSGVSATVGIALFGETPKPPKRTTTGSGSAGSGTSSAPATSAPTTRATNG
ncbi:hypothetical protein EON79_19425, partial [bacterium]